MPQGAPVFDPTKPFTVIGAAPSAPTFDPTKPFKPVTAEPTSWYDSLGTFFDRATKPFQPSEIYKMVQAVNPLLQTGEKSFAQSMAERTQAGEHPHAAFADTLLEWRPVAAAKGILEAQGKLGADAQKDFKEGRIGDGVVKAVNYLLPIFGPGLQHAGEDIQRGNIAAGLGDTVAIGGSVMAPEIAGRVAGAVAARVNPSGVGTIIPKLRSTLTPAEQAALEYVQKQGVQVPASTLTGNGFLKGLDTATEAGTISGSIVGGNARRAREAGLATLGDQLRSKGYGPAITPEEAGRSLVDTIEGRAARDAAAKSRATEALSGRVSPYAETPESAGRGAFEGVSGKAKADAADADYAYTMLREIEADPSRARTFEVAKHPDPVTGEPMEAPKFFAPRGAPKAAVFDAVYADAVKQGWKGTKQELRNAFEERVTQARDLGGDMRAAADEFSNEALLRDVRKIGLRPSLQEGAAAAGGGPRTTQVRGDFAGLVDAFRAGKWRQGGGASIFRKDGRAIDEVVQLLNQDPKYADLDVNGLMSRLHDVAAAGPSAPKMDLEGLLGAVEVRPGSRWWDREAALADHAVAHDVGAVLDGKHLVRSETVPLGVDLRSTKGGLLPAAEHLRLQKQVTGILMGQKGDALTAIETLLQSPDVAPLSVVDAALGDLKALLRKGSRGDGMFGRGQVELAQTVKQLDQAVWKAANEAGPDVVAALKQGRESTVAKYTALDVRDALVADSGVRTFDKLTQPRDVSVGLLRDVQAQAPGALPKVARALLDGFADMEPAAALKAWQKLGPESRALLYPDEKVRLALDQVFKPSPKGSAADVLKLLNTKEPVAAFKQTALTNDAGIERLRALARVAPDEMPKIGRAYLDDLMGKVEKGVKGEGGQYTAWQNLGPGTKTLLFKDPAYIKELDNFFLASKKLAENVNPSGTAKVAAAAAHASGAAAAAYTGHLGLLASQLGVDLAGGAVQKLMQSRRGVNLLTQGLRIPRQLSPGVQSAATTAIRAKVVADLARFAGPEWYRNPVLADDGGNQP